MANTDGQAGSFLQTTQKAFLLACFIIQLLLAYVVANVLGIFSKYACRKGTVKSFEEKSTSLKLVSFSYNKV